MEGYITKGDNNRWEDTHYGQDIMITPEDVKGKVYLGRGCRNMIKKFAKRIEEEGYELQTGENTQVPPIVPTSHKNQLDLEVHIAN